MNTVHNGIEIFGVYDRGVPNKERVVLRVTQTLNLANYFLIVGLAHENNIWPFNDSFLWLTNIEVVGPAWVFIYTGKGTPRVELEMNTKQPLHALYWGKEKVIFDKDISPALVSFGPVEIGNKPSKDLSMVLTPPLFPTAPVTNSSSPKNIDWVKVLNDLLESTKK
ncbi:hypothetical protein [Methylovorus glucosotrophus]|uniref:Uncharacterized protein n=1 Tax=Methylovorus glucosotrophus (strain SIP3-4) TaxID=582744 RepID=C6XCI8_METGS|nr:hypothetical protein [Methylovorus glucosotrophus]ACT50263.1 hypothetical protein Msip34_1016 [Methylovorus glucosotrophus SIP3-4]